MLLRQKQRHQLLVSHIEGDCKQAWQPRTTQHPSQGEQCTHQHAVESKYGIDVEEYGLELSLHTT